MSGRVNLTDAAHDVSRFPAKLLVQSEAAAHGLVQLIDTQVAPPPPAHGGGAPLAH